MINSIRLKNWMNISECTLVFNKGINIIQGKVGEGKSSIFAAIAYALTDYRRGDSWKDYIKTGENFFEIDLTYQFGKDPTNIFSLYNKGEKSKSSVYRELKYGNEDIKKGEEVTQFLDLKLDRQMLSSVIFNLQDSKPLPILSPTERLVIFKKIFNSDFSEAIENIKIDIDVLQKSIDKKQVLLDVLKTKEYPLYRIIPIDPQELINLQEELKQVQLSESNYLKMSQYLEKMTLINNKQLKLAQVNTKIKLYKEAYERNLRSVGTLESNIRDTTTKIDLLKQESDTLESIISQLQIELETYQNSIDINNIQTQIKKDEVLLIEKKANILIQRKYLETHKKGICESCGQSCDVTKIGEFERHITELTQDIKEIEEKISNQKNIITQYTTELTNKKEIIHTKKTELTSKQRDAQNLENTLLSLNKQITELKTTTLIDSKNLIDTTNEDIIQLETDLKTLQEWMDENPQPEIKEGRKAEEIEAQITSIQERVQDNKAHEIINNRSKEEREKDEKEIEHLNLEINTNLARISSLNMAKQIFSVDFPNFINMKACKLLESYMNSFFASTKDRFEVALQLDKKGINFYYKSNGESDWRPIRMVSGFETALSTLGFKVAVASSFGSDIIFLDEPDGNADTETSEKLFQTILSIGGFSQIFIITHKPEIVDLLLTNGEASGYSVQKGKFSELIYMN